MISRVSRIDQKPTGSKACSLPGSRLSARLRVHPRMFLALWLVIANISNPKMAAGQGSSAGEYELKAAMLYNLTRFVEWPTSAYADAEAPTVLCILGRDPFGEALTSLASNPTASGRPVQVRHVPNDQAMRGCHVVYISSSERKGVVQTLSTLKGSSVLTVGEMAQFAARGGMIQFSLEEKQVRFKINLDAASQADLKISSRLLMLARVVKDQSKNPSSEGFALRYEGSEIASLSAAESRNELGEDFQEAAVFGAEGHGERGGSK